MICILLPAFQLSAIQWPVKITYLESTFLENYRGAAFPGLVFRGYDSMRPYDYGEVIFRFSPDDYSALAPVGESMLVLEHENGFQSIYTNLSAGEIRNDRDRLSSGEFLKSPENGEGTGFCHFYIRDALQNQLVNPLILLPAIQDKSNPVIESVILSEGGNDYELKEGLTLPVGPYGVYIRGVDNPQSGIRQSPFGYSLYNLGILQLERTLDAVIQANHELAFQDGTPIRTVFSRPGYLYLGEISLISGQSRLEISLVDVSGNETTKAFNIQVFR